MSPSALASLSGRGSQTDTRGYMDIILPYQCIWTTIPAGLMGRGFDYVRSQRITALTGLGPVRTDRTARMKQRKGEEGFWAWRSTIAGLGMSPFSGSGVVLGCLLKLPAQFQCKVNLDLAMHKIHSNGHMCAF